MTNTTHGLLSDSILDRRTIFEERETEFVVAVEYRLKESCPVPDGRDDITGEVGELVRRDCHVILKAPSVIADALAASLT